MRQRGQQLVLVIQLRTLGGLHAQADEGELDWLISQRLRAALFVYLAIERQVARDVVTAVFWPESDGENAKHALRQCLYQLRKEIGGKWLEARVHELRISPEVRTDAHTFLELIERGESESAARIYGGPFLAGVHLVDVQPWENWVDARRAQYERAFRKACREWLDGKRVTGDQAAAIEAAEWWVAHDPADDEAQHRLIETLADAGERSAAIRQYDAYTRLLEADGLRPLDETIALAERLRSAPAILPSVSAPGRAPAVGASPPAEKRRPHRLVSTALILAMLIAAVAYGWRILNNAAPTISSNGIAVLPFSIHGGADDAYLAEGMVSLLANALDGAAGLRAVDARAVHAAVAGAGSAAGGREFGRGVATRLGAGNYVLGDVVHAGDRLQIEAAIYGDKVARPRARAVVNGGADSLFTMVDRLAAQLLSQIDPAGNARLVRSAALTTSSLPAFKAYLSGEKLMRAGEFERAADAYVEAIAHDSAFGLAFYRLALAREWAPLAGNEEAASAAARHADRLSARERALLDAHRAWRSGDAAEAERAYRAIVARYPEDVEAWQQLGEVQFHQGPLLGRSIDESAPAWRKVLSFEPRNLFAIPHLARIAAVAGRTATIDSLLAPFTRDERESDRRLLEMTLLRALTAGDTTAALRIADAMRNWEDFAVWRVAVFIAAFGPNPNNTVPVIAKLSQGTRDPAMRADLLWFSSLLHLAGGQFRLASAYLASAAAAERTVDSRKRREAFEQVTEWYAATLPLPYADTMLARVRQTAVTAVARTDGTRGFSNELGLGQTLRAEPLREYTTGILSLRLHDIDAAKRAAAALQQLATSGTANAISRDLDRGLRAHIAAAEGRLAEGLALLEALELRDIQGDVAATPFASRANERYLHGALLAQLGRPAEALLWFAALGSGSVTEIPLSALAHLRQAELYKKLGNRADADKHYKRYTEQRRGADANLIAAPTSNLTPNR